VHDYTGHECKDIERRIFGVGLVLTEYDKGQVCVHTVQDPGGKGRVVSDGHRVQPLIANGSSELPCTAALLLQPSIPTEAVVCAAQQHQQGYQSKHI